MRKKKLAYSKRKVHNIINGVPSAQTHAPARPLETGQHYAKTVQKPWLHARIQSKIVRPDDSKIMIKTATEETKTKKQRELMAPDIYYWRPKSPSVILT